MWCQRRDAHFHFCCCSLLILSDIGVESVAKERIVYFYFPFVRGWIYFSLSETNIIFSGKFKSYASIERVSWWSRLLLYYLSRYGTMPPDIETNIFNDCRHGQVEQEKKWGRFMSPSVKTLQTSRPSSACEFPCKFLSLDKVTEVRACICFRVTKPRALLQIHHIQIE